MILIHNPRCKKSREALALLESKNITPEIRLYLKEPLSRTEIAEVIDKLGIPPENIVRRNEPDFKNHYKGKTLTKEAWLDALAKYPKLIERPILINNKSAVIGRPPEKVLNII